MIINMTSGGVVPERIIDEETITPGTENVVLEEGTYLRGPLTILGDEDLIPENIIKGKEIFGVIGNGVTPAIVYEYSGSSAVSYTAEQDSDGNYFIGWTLKLLTSGTLNIKHTETPIIDAYLVGGGGGGGSGNGSGGGGGGYVTTELGADVKVETNYEVIVGSGGAGGGSAIGGTGKTGGTGGTTSAFGLSANGGKGGCFGGFYGGDCYGGDGGSGGGGGGNGGKGGTGSGVTTTILGTLYSGGGGGAVKDDGSYKHSGGSGGSDGSNGSSNDSQGGTPGSGGAGGGGRGAAPAASAANGIANTGGGGGGGYLNWNKNIEQASGSGGSGIVILKGRYS